MSPKPIVNLLSRDIKRMIWINTFLLALSIPIFVPLFEGQGLRIAMMIGSWVCLVGAGNYVFVNTYFLKRADSQIMGSYRRLQSDFSLDELTGVYNRRAGMARLREEFARSRRTSKLFSIAMADVDHFKKINDTYGHIAGDTVLKQIAMSMKTELRESDVLIRFGGEEFLILLPETDERQALQPLDRLRQKLAVHELLYGDLTIRLTISIGIATVLPGDDDLLDVINRADRALYSAKASGRNKVVYNDQVSALRPHPLQAA